MGCDHAPVHGRPIWILKALMFCGRVSSLLLDHDCPGMCPPGVPSILLVREDEPVTECVTSSRSVFL